MINWLQLQVAWWIIGLTAQNLVKIVQVALCKVPQAHQLQPRRDLPFKLMCQINLSQSRVRKHCQRGELRQSNQFPVFFFVTRDTEKLTLREARLEPTYVYSICYRSKFFLGYSIFKLVYFFQVNLSHPVLV